VPRERSVRLAGLAPSAQRGPSTRYRARVSSAIKRRLVAGVLVVASLAMITAYFRESESGAMHDVQDTASTALQPFQIGADRVVAPFRDAWGYMTGLIDAKSEADQLRRERNRFRAEALQNTAAVQRLRQLEALLDYHGPPSLDDFDRVSAEVLVDAPSQYQQRIVIAAGVNDGVRRDYPVIAAGGLAGHVTKAFSNTAQVTLVTDPTSFVSAYDPKTGAYGLIRGRGEGKPLLFDRVKKSKSVSRRQQVTTSGRRYLGLGSLYPRNVGIGEVTSVTHLSTADFKTVLVEPFVDFSSVQSVTVLIPKGPVFELPADDAG
jgi:rod shape-determining protein MreC